MALKQTKSNISATLPLASWQAPVHSGPALRLRWLVTAMAVLGVATLIATSLAPYRIVKPTIVLLIPEHNGAELAQANAEQARISLSSAQWASQAFERFSQVTGFVCARPGVLVGSPTTLLAALRCNDDGQGPMIVYAAGILSVTSQGCHLSESSSAESNGQSLKVATLLDAVVHSRSEACILCLEVWSDQNSLATTLAPGLAVAKCREEIESYLASVATQPIAVLVTPAVEYASNKLPTLLESLAETTLRLSSQTGIRVNTHDFLAELGHLGDIQEKWLVSNAWNERQVALNLPQAAPPAVSVSSTSAVAPSASPLTGKPVSTVAVNENSIVQAVHAVDHNQPNSKINEKTLTASVSNRDNELLELIQPTTNEAAAQTRLAAWDVESVMDGAEINIASTLGTSWGKHFLLETGLPWQLRQSLLRNKLLSLRLLGSCHINVSQFADLADAERHRISSEQIVARQFGQDWLIDATEQSSMAYKQLQDCEAYLLARSKATAIVERLCGELPDWDRVLTPNQDRQTSHDRICQCIERIVEVHSRLARYEVDDTEDLLRLSDELTVMRTRWMAEAEKSLQTPSSAHIDVAQFLQSSMVGSRELRVVNQSVQAGHDWLPEHAAIWMRAQRHTAMLRLLELFAQECAQTDRAHAGPHEIWSKLMQLAECCSSSSSTNQDVLNALDSVSEARHAWLRRVSNAFSGSTLISCKSAALALLAGLVPDCMDHERCRQEIEQSQQLENIRLRAEYCVTQLEFCEQRSALILHLERQLLNRMLVGVGRAPVLDPADGLWLALTESIDLSVAGKQLVPVRIVNNTQRVQRCRISASCDADRIECWFQQVERRTQAVPVSSSANSLIGTNAGIHSESPNTRQWNGELEPYSSRELLLNIVLQDQARGIAYTVLQLDSPEGKRCYQIETRLPNPQLFTLRMVNRHGYSAESNDNTVESLFGNRMNSLAMELTNQQPHALHAMVRVLASESTIEDIPSGVMNAAQVDAWLSTQAVQLLMDNTPAALMQSRQSQLMKLPPLRFEPQQANHCANQLLFVVTAVGTDQTQVFAWTPRTVRPATYVHPRVSYDALRSEVRCMLNLVDSVCHPTEPVSIVARYSDLEHLDTECRATLQLSRQHAARELLLKLPKSEAKIGLLRVDVDDWPNAFVYRVNRHESREAIPLAEEIQSIGAKEESGRQVLASFDRFVSVEVDAIVSDGHFSAKQETVFVGLDLDQDRTLQTESSIKLPTVLESTIFWHGCDADGNMLLQSQVRRPIVTLPVSKNWNGKCAILAGVQRAEVNLWSMSRWLTIDHVPPRILAVEVAGENDPLLGKPIEVRVRVDDGGLSGVALVQAMWSLTGVSEIPDAAPMVNAVKLRSDTWALMLPTTELLSGNSLLLVRAQDQAGNISRTYQQFIEVLDEAATRRKQESITTTVYGRVRFGEQPLIGIELTLSRKDDLAKLWQTQTNAVGEFAFKDIPTGNYQLELSGLVRGMRTKRTRDVNVVAPQAITPIQFRLDRPEPNRAEKQS